MVEQSASRGFQESPGSSSPPVPESGEQVRRVRADTAYASQFATAAFAAQVRPIADPHGALPAYRFGFHDTGRVVVGIIMDGTPVANCYRVHLEKGFAPIVATACTHGSSAALGAASINTYAPGTPVIVMVHDKNNIGYILGGMPSILDVGRRGYHDYISQASRKRVDELHKKHIKQKDGGQIADYSAWRPIDATLASEWGGISSTGVRVTVDDFMAQMAVNEFCGVYGFYHDSLLRVAGTNMQVWTGGSERDAFVDQAECNDTTGYAPYPWEAMGVLEPGQQVIEEYSSKSYLCPKQKPYYAHWENKSEYQQPYHRSQLFYGYLGQGARSVVHAPPQGIQRWTYKPGPNGAGDKPYEGAPGNDYGELQCEAGPTKEQNHEEQPCFGLHEDNIALDGRRFIASAKGIVLSKRTLLPVPQRLKRPDTPDGDTDKDYKFSSKHGDGPEHKITGDIETTDSDYPNLQRAAAVLDLHGYLFNYAGLHPFYWHAKDYKTWEQSELTRAANTNHKVPEFSELTGSMFLKSPEPKKWKIDHRYGEQDYYEMESFISLLEDGGIVIGDGYGGEIRMTGGSVTISAPGDVWLKSGRNTNIWSGADCSVRANHSLDLSTTEDSIRVKSEKHFMLLAGNGEQEGGVLIESRSPMRDYDFENCGDDVKFGGVVLRARKSNVAGIGDSIYMGTPEDASDGKIIMDAAKGKRDFVTGSNNVFNYIKTGVFHAFGTGKADRPVVKSNGFLRDITSICGIFSAERDTFIDGNVMAKKSLFSATGHVFTAKAKDVPFVLPTDPGTLSEVIDRVTNFVSVELPEAVSNASEANKLTHFDPQKIGNKEVHKKLAFSFRTDDQYGIPEFLIYEDRWQQMAGIAGKSVKRWEEKEVKSFGGCDSTYPYPGKKWLTSEPAYMQQELAIAEFVSGGLRDIDRGAAPGLAGGYSQPKFGSNSPVTLNGNYAITGKDK